MKLTFWGAARKVTGSMFLLELEDEYKILIDCGLDISREPEEKPEGQWGIFPFEPSQINLLILTHAHIDHSGFIPNLIREGFEGKIICTAPTISLTQLLLEDSASLNQRKLKRIQHDKRNGYNKSKVDVETLYMPNHVNKSMEYFYSLEFNTRSKIKKGAYLTLIPTGHLLGAANVILEIEENGKTKKICFSGDIGRKNYPLLSDPQQIPEVDYLICESTYGNRRHRHKGKPEDMLIDIIKEVCVGYGGRLIIPAFSVGRTQALLYVLNKLCQAGVMPPVKIFADSPLALNSTQVYQKYKNYMNEEAQEFVKKNQYLFDFENLIYLENNKESKAVSKYPEPCIIISSSGMIQGGRIEQHVRANIQNPKATILMIGYAAEGTMGYDLLNGKKTIQDKKKRDITITAKIANIDIFSGHADVDDLMDFVKSQSTQSLKKIFLVHGEYESMLEFKETLGKEGYDKVEIPKKGDSFEL